MLLILACVAFVYAPLALFSETGDTFNYDQGWTQGDWLYLANPGQPTNPNPADDVLDIPVDQNLSWTNGPDTETIDLYFADDEVLVTNKDISVRVIEATLVDTYVPGVLDLDTDYFWRVVAHNSDPATTDGPVWSFHTSAHYLLYVSKGMIEHANDVVFTWLPENIASLFFKYSPHLEEAYQLLISNVVPCAYHSDVLDDGQDYYYQVTDSVPTCSSGGSLFATDNIIGPMRCTPPETFTQGSPTDEPCRAASETQFSHTLTRAIVVMETEVTRQMWADLLAAQPSLPPDPTNSGFGGGMTNPVNRVTWYEAVLFANMLSQQNMYEQCYYKDAAFTEPVTSTNYTSGAFYCNFEANGYRLLTEGEWEYAARAGSTGPFFCVEPNYSAANCTSCTSGTHPTLEQYAVYCANDTNKSEPVGSKLGNPWSLMDMLGNVREWCWDWYSPTYPASATDYHGPTSGSDRVLRGGYWMNTADNCRSAYRGYYPPYGLSYSVGFRLARTPAIAPVILNISDLDACAQNGISIIFSAGDGASRHDLWVDGVETVTNISNPYVYDPPDTFAHDYVIRAIIGNLYFDSAVEIFSDLNDVVVIPPEIIAIANEELCAGIRVSYTAGVPALSHDLYDESGLLVVDYVSNSLFQPNDSDSHNYFIQALTIMCFDNSLPVSFSTEYFTPEPTITGPTINTCPAESVTLATETGQNNYQWYLDSSLLAGETNQTFLATSSGSYTVSYENGSGCLGLSSGYEILITCCNNCSAGDLYSVDNIVGQMYYVPGGTFTQGSPSTEPCRSIYETQFNHTLTRNIIVMETEVTRQMWANLLIVQPTLVPDPTDPLYGAGLSNPVNSINWNKALLFANLLSLQNGLTRCYYANSGFTVPIDATNYYGDTFFCDFSANGYRLLTEGEWEYAARAGTTGPFSCTESNYSADNCSSDSCIMGTLPSLEQNAIFCANGSTQSAPVGSKLPNPWQLKDLHGNLYEWCWDFWSDTYPGDSTDYTGPASGSYRLIRGGSFNTYAIYCRSAYRDCNMPEVGGYSYGLRLARTVN